MSQEPPDETPERPLPDSGSDGAPLGAPSPEGPAAGETRTMLHADPAGTAVSTADPRRPDEAVPGNGPRSKEPQHRRRHRHRWIAEWAVIIAIALVAAFLVRTFVVETFYVPSTSMWPTLKAGDRIVVNKLYGTIHTGDIVVFKRPPAEKGACGGRPVPDLVKRVVGLPGQTVSAQNGDVYITGKRLAEPWLPKSSRTYTRMSTPYTVPKGDYFVMGDNRVNSCDSRTWGPVKSSYVVGKVFLIIWPPGRLRFF